MTTAGQQGTAAAQVAVWWCKPWECGKLIGDSRRQATATAVPPVGGVENSRCGGMTRLRNLIEIIVVTLCLPFYAIAWPFMRWNHRNAIRRISAQSCASCGEPLSGISSEDLRQMGFRFRLTAGASIRWDRLPQWSLTCPSCTTKLCFDREYRPTACDLSDAITRREERNREQEPNRAAH